MADTRFQIGTCLLAALAFVGLTACSDDDTDQSGVEICGPGETMTESGECVRGTGAGTGGTSGDGGMSGSGTSGTTSGSGSGGDAGGSSSGGTSGGSSGGQTCGGCPDGEFCLEGECRPGTECQPGEVLGCKDEHSLRVCPDGGVGFEIQQCGADKPNCVNSECTKKVCEPDTRYCKGNTNFLMECSSDGMNETQVKECRGGCRNGQCVSACSGNAKTYIGCDFMAIDLDNYIRKCSAQRHCGPSSECDRQKGVCKSCGLSGDCFYSNATDQPFGITVSNTRDHGKIKVDVTDRDGNNVKSVDIPGNTLKTIGLPKQNISDSELTDKSYRVKANGPITVHQFNPENQSDVFSNDASLLLPANALGTEYIVTGWPSLRSPRRSTPNNTNRAYMTIGAVKSGKTTVSVTPKGDIVAGNGVPRISAGQTEQFTLTEGQVVNLTAKQESGNDLTGSVIEADQEVAVFSGHECANVPTDVGACDHLEQQMYPVDVWGKQYVLSKFKPRGDEDDIYRLVASEDGTTLSTDPPLSGVDGETLDRGEMHEFKLKGNIIVSADKPVAVGQFMVGSQYPGVSESCETRRSKIGDPAFLLNVPTDQFRKDYFVLTPEGYKKDFINIIAKDGSNITVDGDPLMASGQAVGSAGTWTVYQIDVDTGVHHVESAKAKFGLYSYGYECDVSYAYPGGLDLSTSPSRPGP